MTLKNKNDLEFLLLETQRYLESVLMLMPTMPRGLGNRAVHKEPAEEIRSSLLDMCVWWVPCTLYAHASEGQGPTSSIVPQGPPP